MPTCLDALEVSLKVVLAEVGPPHHPDDCPRLPPHGAIVDDEHFVAEVGGKRACIFCEVGELMRLARVGQRSENTTPESDDLRARLDLLERVVAVQMIQGSAQGWTHPARQIPGILQGPPVRFELSAKGHWMSVAVIIAELVGEPRGASCE